MDIRILLPFLIAILDLPWLLLQTSSLQKIIDDIQGRPMQVRLWASIPVYIALAYIVSQIRTLPVAFFTGVSVYAVYDFTQIVTFDKYPISFALADSLWGGILLSASWILGQKFGLLKVPTY